MAVTGAVLDIAMIILGLDGGRMEAQMRLSRSVFIVRDSIFERLAPGSGR
jgi:hypothetical protein